MYIIIAGSAPPGSRGEMARNSQSENEFVDDADDADDADDVDDENTVEDGIHTPHEEDDEPSRGKAAT